MRSDGTTTVRTEVVQPYGAVTLPPPPARQRDPRLLRLLKWTIPLVVISVVSGSSLIGLWAWSASTARAAGHSDWSQARVAYEQQASLTRRFPQPWLAQYNLGTVLVDDGDLEGGLELLHIAYEGVPKAIPDEMGMIGPFSYECAVRFNISAALELQGDGIGEQEDDTIALDLYESALDWVAPCQIAGGGGGGSADDDTDNPQDSNENGGSGESVERLQEKIDEIRGNDGQPDQNGEQTGDKGQAPTEADGETDEQREQREELEQKNQEQSERERERDESRNRNPGVGGW